MSDIYTTKHHFSTGIYAREMNMPKGYIVQTHTHKFDHISILAKGNVIVTVNEVRTEYNAPACIEIKAGIEHKIESLSDITWFCVHATDEKNADNLDDVLIGKE